MVLDLNALKKDLKGLSLIITSLGISNLSLSRNTFGLPLLELATHGAYLTQEFNLEENFLTVMFL